MSGWRWGAAISVAQGREPVTLNSPRPRPILMLPSRGRRRPMRPMPVQFPNDRPWLILVQLPRSRHQPILM